MSGMFCISAILSHTHKTHCMENAFYKEWRKMQDAQDWLV